LSLRVTVQMQVEIREQGLADVLQSGFLRLSVSVHQSPEADMPGVVGELDLLRLGERSERFEGIGTGVVDAGFDGIGGEGDASGEVRMNHADALEQPPCQRLCSTGSVTFP
jgi:hypothetical protein